MGLFGAFMFGEGVPDLFQVDSLESFHFVTLIIMLIGAAIGVFREFLGSLVIAIGYFLFTSIEGDFGVGTPFAAFPVISVLYLIAWLFTAKKKKAVPPPKEVVVIR